METPVVQRPIWPRSPVVAALQCAAMLAVVFAGVILAMIAVFAPFWGFSHIRFLPSALALFASGGLVRAFGGNTEDWLSIGRVAALTVLLTLTTVLQWYLERRIGIPATCLVVAALVGACGGAGAGYAGWRNEQRREPEKR